MNKSSIEDVEERWRDGDIIHFFFEHVSMVIGNNFQKQGCEGLPAVMFQGSKFKGSEFSRHLKSYFSLLIFLIFALLFHTFPCDFQCGTDINVRPGTSCRSRAKQRWKCCRCFLRWKVLEFVEFFQSLLGISKRLEFE